MTDQTNHDIEPSLFELAVNGNEHVMAVDQAFDGTGVAFYFPLVRRSSLFNFIRKNFPILSDRYGEHLTCIKTQLWERQQGAITIEPKNKRKKAFSFGYLFPVTKDSSPKVPRRKTKKKEDANDDPLLCAVIHGSIEMGASDLAEWSQSDVIANMLVAVATEFKKHIGLHCPAHLPNRLKITLEGLAAHGSQSSIAILPCLGVLYAAIWRRFHAAGLSDQLGEMPISSWKRAALNNGAAKKTDIKQFLYDHGFSRFNSDDESDAVAMCLVSCAYPGLAKKTGGRIRPTREAQAEKRKIRLDKKREKEKRLLICEEKRPEKQKLASARTITTKARPKKNSIQAKTKQKARRRG